MIVVPDAGPLIYLGGAGHLDILRRLYSEVVVPRVVLEEIVIAGAGLTGAREVEAASWLRIEDVPSDPSLMSLLDPGEAAAIPLAERLGAALLVDDARAREVAKKRGLVVVGTVGVLLIAKRKAIVLEVGPIIARMEALGMFLSPELREAVLRVAGE